MGTAYTYLIADLRRGVILDELPLSGVSFNKRLNDTGSLRGQLHVRDPVIRDREPRLLTEPGRTAIYVDRDGDLLWGGVVWTSRYSAAGGMLELGASDFLSYFEHRRVLDPNDLTEGFVHPDTDQVTIARDVIQLVQSHDGGDLGIVFTGAQSSGVTRSVSYPPGELKPVADLLRDLSNADGGFDFTFDIRYDENGQPERFLHIGYPRLGQPGAPHVWEYGANLIDFAWPVDASTMATRVFAQGTGDANEPILRVAEDRAAYSAGWPLLEDAASQLDTKNAALLDAHARGELAARRRPVVLPELTVRADLDPTVGTYTVGDDARIIIEDPFFAAERLDVTVRILGFEVTPGDDGGQEEVKLTVAPIPEPS